MLKNNKQKIRTAFCTVMVWLLLAQMSFADTISNQTAEDVSGSVYQWVSAILKPLGAIIIFVAVVICAVKIIMTANRPEKRTEAIGALPYILGGGILLGAASLVAGFILGSWDQFQ